jgi:hypothetical protein
LAALALPIAIGARPVPGEPVAVIGSPFRSEADQFGLVAAAGGDIVQSVSGFVTITSSDDPRFVAKLYAAGAVVVIRSGILTACLPYFSGSNSPPKENA